MIILLSLYSFSPDSLIDEAVRLYQTRHLNEANLLRSYQILDSLSRIETLNVRINYELAHVAYLIGDRKEDKEAKMVWFKKGVAYGKKALEIDDHSVGAHFWYLVNLGRIAELEGGLKAMGKVGEIKEEIDRVLELDSLHTGALDAKAMLLFRLPGFMGGDRKRAKELLKRAIAIDPNYTRLYLDLARIYLKEKNYDQAQTCLERVLSVKNPTIPADYHLHDRPEAMKLLRKGVR
ncbi:hypothetical protein DRP53_09920 [candidate division WOR-3 bacterium]|uniref:Tetratricopeptide repeat protein n=1 Tax=candidate division WOR-3 bacterium TaxID=2052148 RepID=A0A660SDG0_UNCW3|nr:MAG: hypothetical protein DRP53_09920 [candidate division WOR-3 bacterium]